MSQLNLYQLALALSLVANGVLFYNLQSARQTALKWRDGAFSLLEGDILGAEILGWADHLEELVNQLPDGEGVEWHYRAKPSSAITIPKGGDFSHIRIENNVLSNYPSDKPHACYAGMNSEGLSVYHGYGSQAEVEAIVAGAFAGTASPNGSTIAATNQPLDWEKYGNCAN